MSRLFLRSLCVLAALATSPLSAATITVTNTNDSGPGSLRNALTQATLSAGNRIEFAIGSGPQTIQPSPISQPRDMDPSTP